jgi:formate hydrogenlyase transcriptional activator
LAKEKSAKRRSSGRPASFAGDARFLAAGARALVRRPELRYSKGRLNSAFLPHVRERHEMSSTGRLLAAAPSAAIEPELEDQLRFERLVADLIARFVNVSPERLDHDIEDTLRCIVDALDLDRSTLLQVNDAGDMIVTHSWAPPGLTRVSGVLVKEEFPWLLARARRGEVTPIVRLEDLPGEAWRDRETLKRLGNKSTIVVPCVVSGELVGAIAFGTMRSERPWPEALIPRLVLVANVFGGALARKRADVELRQSFDEIERLRERLRRENSYLKEESLRCGTGGRIIGQSSALQSVLTQVEQVARTAAPVLLLGETGVGKELVAEAIHARSQRRDRVMVKVNCAALPASLVEGELFGREKGAYTGALTKQIGRFELAHESTLFLDEVAELPLELQAKLLRVLQQGEFERLGSPRTIRVDVRIIAATNRDLEKEVAEGRFRSDLYYRLAVFPISVPPLRERTEDVALIVRSIVDEVSRSMGKEIDQIDEASLERLRHYSWPGNVRELRNVVERAIIVCPDRTLTIDLPDRRTAADMHTLKLEHVERHHISSVLERTGWRIRGAQGAAAILGMPPTTLESRMAKLGLRRLPAPERSS